MFGEIIFCKKKSYEHYLRGGNLQNRSDGKVTENVDGKLATGTVSAVTENDG